MKWKIPNTRMRGRMHLQLRIECQDWVRVLTKDEFACVTMADGAGSVKNAESGALLVAEATRDYLQELMKSSILFDMSEEGLREDLVTELKIKLHDFAQKSICEFGSLASTLLFFATDGKRFLAGNLGDGLIGVIDGHNHAETLLCPENGNFLNESFFVTDDDCMNHLRLIHGDFNLSDIYFLMTDGSCDCLYDRKSKTFADALGVFADWTRQYNQERASDGFYKTMTRFFSQRTSDDCALALIKGDY